MGFLFGKKETAQAMAELIDDGREIANEAMKSPRFNDYHRAEPQFEMRVRVLPDAEAPWQAMMKAGLGSCVLLLPGTKVSVAYRTDRREQVELVDDLPAILARNPQLKRSE